MRQAPTTLDGLMADIAGRLRPVVSDMPESEFTALVRRMAEVEMKYHLHQVETDWRQVTPPLGVPHLGPPA